MIRPGTGWKMFNRELFQNNKHKSKFQDLMVNTSPLTIPKNHNYYLHFFWDEHSTWVIPAGKIFDFNSYKP